MQTSKKKNFKYEGIDFPLKFITVHETEESFVKQGKKQFFVDKTPQQQEKMLKEVYKTGKDMQAALDAEDVADEQEEKPKNRNSKVKPPSGSIPPPPGEGDNGEGK